MPSSMSTASRRTPTPAWPRPTFEYRVSGSHASTIPPTSGCLTSRLRSNALARDLHDSVQQELLALGLDSRLAIGSLPDGSADRTPQQQALDLVHDAVE